MGKKTEKVEMILIGSKTKEAMKATGLNVSGECFHSLGENSTRVIKFSVLYRSTIKNFAYERIAYIIRETDE